MALDTHAYVKKLQEAGFTAQQAEAQVEVLVTIVEGNLATKQDLKEMETHLDHKIELLRRDTKEAEARQQARTDEMETRMDGRFKEVDGKFRLLYWMLGFNLTLTLFSLSLTAGILFKLMAG